MSQQIQDAKCIACTKTARERAVFSTLCSLSCSLLFVSLVTSQVIAADFSGRVVGIIDGDTLEVLHHQRAERIRLNGIDCPEKAQAYGTRAKLAVADLAFGKEVTVKTHGLDKYKRTLADLFLPDGTNVNYTLVKEGWCWWYRKYAPGDTVLERLEKNAREARKGLWADPQPVPPWEWRKRRK
jgi:micrococcal nuclease